VLLTGDRFGFALVAGEVKALGKSDLERHPRDRNADRRDTEGTNAAVGAIRRIFHVINRVGETTTSIVSILDEQIVAIGDISRSAAQRPERAPELSSNGAALKDQVDTFLREVLAA
jgi:hypothetical protein